MNPRTVYVVPALPAKMNRPGSSPSARWTGAGLTAITTLSPDSTLYRMSANCPAGIG